MSIILEAGKGNMGAIKVTAGVVFSIIALGAVLDGCNGPSTTAATVTATPTSSWPPQAQEFYRDFSTMPDVRGWDRSGVDTLFNPVMSTVKVIRKTDAKMREGMSEVTKQEPAAGAKLVEGQTVKLWITYGTKRPTPKSSTTVEPRVRDWKRDADRNRSRDRGESRFCSGRWWC